jgi:Na+-transporting methylmalonyl-CoA/oxaloacetate decarboxylase gamma subunit
VALSDDQKAILRLLAQRGAAGYEDLAALLGISVSEVHARAKGAAEQLEAEGIPAPAIPEPGSSDTEPAPQPPVEAQSPPPSPSPAPAKPKKPRPRPALPKGEPKPPLKRELKLLEGRGLWAILAGVAIVVVFLVILFVVGGGGGGSSDSGSSAAATTDNCKVSKAPKPNKKLVATLAAAAVKTGKETTRAVLDPVDGSEAIGLAIFGRVKKSLALQVAAEGLPPSGNCGYTVWIAASPTKMLPLASTEVKKDGRINAQVEVPVEILGYLANETFGQIAITRTDESQLKASLADATKEKEAPVYTGTEILRGSVRGPIVGAAKRLEAKEAGKGK